MLSNLPKSAENCCAREFVLGIAHRIAGVRLGTDMVKVVDSTINSDWILVSGLPLDAAALTSWATRGDCGAVVCFSGTARDTSTVDHVIKALEYDASVELAQHRIAEIVHAARLRWPELGAVGVHHRVGLVAVGEPAVVIVISSPHRQAAYEASQFCIDSVKKCVPMWKRELWEGGSAWSETVHDLLSVQEL